MNLNRKQSQVILYGIGISAVLAFLAFLLYSTITDAMSGLAPQEIKDAIISGIITYGGVVLVVKNDCICYNFFKEFKDF